MSGNHTDPRARKLLPLLSFGLILVALQLPLNLSAQVIGSWEVFTALEYSTSIASAPDSTLWVGTTGGVYHYTPATGNVEVYNSTNILQDITVSAVNVDPNSGDVYVGSSDGSITIFRSDGWHTFVGDIAHSGRIDRTIRGFRFYGGTTYILTTFGVVLFSPTDSVVRDSWTQFSTILPNSRVNDLLFYHDSIWVALDSGLVIAPASGHNLSDPLRWRLYNQMGLCRKQALALAVIEGDLIVGTDDGICQLHDGIFSRRDDVDGPIRFGFSGERIVAASDSRLYSYGDDGHFRETATAPNRMQAVASLPDGMPVGAMERGGILIQKESSAVLYAPNGPVSNTVEDFAFGRDGSLWMASGITGTGLSRLIGGKWINYTAETTAELKSNATWRVNVDNRGRVWVGTYGGGLSLFAPEDGTNVSVTHYDGQNSPLLGSYITDAKADESGNVWLLNWYDASDNGSVLLSFSTNLSSGSEEFRDFSAYAAFPSLDIHPFSHLAIDFNGTKWLGCDRSNGLLFFNEALSERGKWGLVTTTNGLPSNTQTALLVDPDGELWIGTPVGLVVLVNPGSVLQNGSSSAIFRTIRSLENVFIRDIAVDALNRKWVGTDNGIVVLSSDGTEVLTTVTKENSPLVNNQIRSILPNEETGDIYIGTTGGLNKIKTEAIRSVEVSELRATPQPYMVPTGDPLRITGLPINSSVKIMTVSGALVREFVSPGGSVAFWDGKDGGGEFVSSGVYVIAAKSNLGETVIGKVAVVRP